MTKLQPSTAIITGASRGIGAAVAGRLAQDGLAVVINYASGSEQADTLVVKIEADGGKAIAINLKGVFNGLREAAGRLWDGGRIVSLSSSLVGLHQPTYALYAAAK